MIDRFQNGYRGRRRSLIEDARFETMLHREQELPKIDFVDDAEADLDSAFENEREEDVSVAAVLQCEGPMAVISDMISVLAVRGSSNTPRGTVS